MSFAIDKDTIKVNKETVYIDTDFCTIYNNSLGASKNNKDIPVYNLKIDTPLFNELDEFMIKNNDKYFGKKYVKIKKHELQFASNTKDFKMKVKMNDTKVETEHKITCDELSKVFIPG